MKLDELVNAVDLRRVDAPKLLALIDAKIDRIDALGNKIAIASLLASLLLFASLYGVEFEIDFLGIKLEGITKLKELIFCGISLAGLFAAVSQGTVRHLKEIRKRLFIRKYGEQSYAIYAPALNDHMSYDFDVPVGTERYFPTLSTVILESVRIFFQWIPFFVAVAASLFIAVFIAFDIWGNSNLPEPWGKVLVLVVYVGLILQSIASIFSHFWQYRFVDIEKAKELKVHNPDTGEVHPVLRTLIQRQLGAQQLRRGLIKMVVAAMFTAALLLSSAEFEGILEYVRNVVVQVAPPA